MSEPRSDQEWVDFYAAQSGIYEVFVERLEGLLETLLVDDGIGYSWASSFWIGPVRLAYILNLARRAGRAFDNPLESPLRVAGVSVVVETPVSVSEIGGLVGREFVVDPAGTLSIEEAAGRSERPAEPAGSDGLAYEFPHYLVSLDERRLELPEWAPFAGLKVRIEVRTLLQSSWLWLEDDLPFDVASSYPAEVRDLLARSSRGMSAIDADLAEAKDAILRLFAEYEEAIAAGDLQLPVNGVSLLAYMRTSELVRSLTELGQDVGLEADPEYAPDWYEIEHRILWLLRRSDVHTVDELEDFLKQATPRARDTLTELARVATDRGFTPWAWPESVVEWLWLVLRRADTETISLLRYADEVEYALNTLIGNPTAQGSDAP